MVLAQESDIEVVGEAGDAEAAVERAAELLPDVVCLSWVALDMDGYSPLRATLDNRIKSVVNCFEHRKERGAAWDADLLVDVVANVDGNAGHRQAAHDL